MDTDEVPLRGEGVTLKYAGSSCGRSPSGVGARLVAPLFALFSGAIPDADCALPAFGATIGLLGVAVRFVELIR